MSSAGLTINDMIAAAVSAAAGTYLLVVTRPTRNAASSSSQAGVETVGGGTDHSTPFQAALGAAFQAALFAGGPAAFKAYTEMMAAESRTNSV